MDRIKEHVIENLRLARQVLLDIPKDNLSSNSIHNWLEAYKSVFYRADSISGSLLIINIRAKMRGFWEVENEPDLFIELRVKIIELIDNVTQLINGQNVVKPILDELISKVSDPKLSQLLLEFNAIRNNQPNIASIGFRTILPLIIRERAKRIDPNNTLAVKDDLGFEPDIRKALEHPTLFSSAEKKLISRYMEGGNKDIFDNVAHKPVFLIDKTELEDAVSLLNHLLPTITD